MKKISIAYIGGGSRVWDRNLMNDLVSERKIHGNVNLYDIDYEAALMNERIGNLYNSANGAVSEWKYKAFKEINGALEGADFVVVSILPGSFDDMEQEVHYPEKYGIWQSVGDTVGPGGIMRAVRAIPMYEYIAVRIKNICPNAYIMSFTIPMTVLIKTIYEAFPKSNVFGCCHEVFGTQRLIGEMPAIEGIAQKTSRKDIKTNVLGINYFIRVDSVEYKGLDITHKYLNFVKKYRKTGFNKNKKWDEIYFPSGIRVKFGRACQYGIIVAAGDRHLAEFCPGRYLKNPDTVNEWQFSLTPVSWRKKDRMERIQKTQKLFNGEIKPEITNSGEEGVALIKALIDIGDLGSNVNILNTGQHKGLPQGAVVETNAIFSNNNIEPIPAGRLPGDVEALVIRHVYNQNNLVRACLGRNIDGVLSVFLNDPLVHLPKNKAVKLFTEMFALNKFYWEMG